MAREVFVDAGAWVAVTSQRDQYHGFAVKIYTRLLEERRTLVTTNLVLAEAYAGIRRNAPQPVAGKFLASINETSSVLRVYSDQDLEAEAEQILRKYADQDFSLTDAVSFVVMRQRKIRNAFAFDSHFTTAGFVQLE